MKIFVGTLYSGENEYKECIDSINRQSYRDFDHYIFENLANKEAHVTLYQSFLEKADKYDVLIKVDADMVLANETVFEKIIQKLENNLGLDLFAIAVHDFFTDQLIWGLNSYRNTVRWDFKKDTIFVDIPELPRERMEYDDTILAPAAFHCKNPSRFQAFHYGIHRGLKSIQTKGGSEHWESLKRTRTIYNRKRDSRLGLAILGAEMVYAGIFQINNVDYSNHLTKSFFEKVETWNSKAIDTEIMRLQLFNWWLLPSIFRRKLLISRINPK